MTARDPRPPAARRGLAFREVMRGHSVLPAAVAGARLAAVDGARTRGRVVLALAARIPDLRAFLDDPTHAAELTGTVEVDGMTAGPAPVTGTLHLLATVDGGPARATVYLLPFTAADGTAWLLRGTKQVRRRRWVGPWRATTVLDIAITAPAHRSEGMAPTGQVTIRLRDVLRMATTVRATGDAGLAGQVATLLRFGGFGAGQIARAYLTPARRASRR